MALLPHQQRVVDEKNELDKKMTSLYQFLALNSLSGLAESAADQIPEDEMQRLNTQLCIMGAYSSILQERINNFPKVD